MNEKEKMPEDRRNMYRVLIGIRGSGDRYGATEMNFYLDRLKEEMGTSRQFLVFQMLRFAFDHDARYGGMRETLKAEWDKLQNMNHQ